MNSLKNYQWRRRTKEATIRTSWLFKKPQPNLPRIFKSHHYHERFYHWQRTGIKGQSHIIVLIKTNYHVLLSTPVPQFILHRQLDHFSCCQRHKTGVLPLPRYEKPTPFLAFPSARWFLVAYVRDVWSRMDVLLATATSTHGSILKVDSIKSL